MNESDNATAKELAAVEVLSGEKFGMTTGTGINPNPNP
jgi:chorismate synthase